MPFPHGLPERLFHYAPRDALYLLTIYDDWGEAKLRRFERLGLRTHVLWRRQEKLTSGADGAFSFTFSKSSRVSGVGVTVAIVFGPSAGWVDYPASGLNPSMPAGW